MEIACVKLMLYYLWGCVMRLLNEGGKKGRRGKRGGGVLSPPLSSK